MRSHVIAVSSTAVFFALGAALLSPAGTGCSNGDSSTSTPTMPADPNNGGASAGGAGGAVAP